MSTNKEQEADALMKQGRKHLEKTLLHWKPNHDSAAEEFEKAAKLYTNIRNMPKARDAWTKASAEHEKARNSFFAARCMDSLANFLADYVLDRNDVANTADDHTLVDATRCFETAARLYVADNKIDRQAAMLTKAADISLKIAKREMDRAGRSPAAITAAASSATVQEANANYIRFTNEAIAALELDREVNGKSPYGIADLYRGCIQFFIRHNDIKAAVEMEKRLMGCRSVGQVNGAYDAEQNVFSWLRQPSGAAKAGLEIIVLCLAYEGDAVWARLEMDRLRGVFGFSGSGEEQAAAALLGAFDERDPELLADALKSYSQLNFLSSDVSRIAKKLAIGPSIARKPPPNPAPGVVVGGDGSHAKAATKKDEAEEEELPLSSSPPHDAVNRTSSPATHVSSTLPQQPAAHVKGQETEDIASEEDLR